MCEEIFKTLVQLIQCEYRVEGAKYRLRGRALRHPLAVITHCDRNDYTAKQRCDMVCLCFISCTIANSQLDECKGLFWRDGFNEERNCYLVPFNRDDDEFDRFFSFAAPSDVEQYRFLTKVCSQSKEDEEASDESV